MFQNLILDLTTNIAETVVSSSSSQSIFPMFQSPNAKCPEHIIYEYKLRNIYHMPLSGKKTLRVAFLL